MLYLAGLGLLASVATADEVLSAAAKKIFTEKQDCVLWVSAVAKTTFSAEGSSDSAMNFPDQENKMEALGTVIDSAGLVVASLSQIDPSRNFSGRVVRGVKMEATSALKEVKVTLADGTEIPAVVVMKDTDLDLAFLRIKMDSKEARGVTLKAVDLKDSGTGSIMDRTITITRMDEVLNRVAAVNTGEINMITKKPRVFLRAGGGMGGCPTFLMDGKLLGITTARLVKNRNPVGVILPASDILEIAEQAKSAKAEEATPAEAKPEKN
jgi:hypothetical protein